jgi:hypothetical protein
MKDLYKLWSPSFGSIVELSKNYTQKRKLRANFFKIEITTSQGAKGNFVVVLK